MKLVRAYQYSVVGRGVRASAVGDFFSAPTALDPPILEYSLFTSKLAKLPWARGLVGVLTLVAIAGSSLSGNWVATGMLCLFLGARYFPTAALGLTPSLLLFAPKLPLAVLGDEVLFVRLDQAAIGGMVVALFLDRDRPLRTPPALDSLLFLLVALSLSVIAGVVQGTLNTPTSALLYLGQWLLWFGLFITAYSLAPRLGQWAVYVWSMPLIALAAYGLAEAAWPYYDVPGVHYRTFERGLFPGQANHVGGLLALATVTGIALATTPRHRVLGLALALLSTLALFPTGSRSGGLAWAVGLAAIGLLYLPPLRWWGPPLAFVAVVALPPSLWYRFSAPGSSMYDRLVAWKSALSTLGDYPLLGLGAGARHRSFYDNHYVMTLAESGLIGLVLLLLFLVILGRALARVRNTSTGANPIATGALAGLAVMAIHSMATASFIVTLVAGPFFWLCGMALRGEGDRP